MKFVSVTIQNFLSFGDAQTISLEKRGLVAVLGENNDSKGASSNGSGKSSIMEAIVWALFGKTMRGYSADDVVNRNVGKNCIVSLEMCDGTTNYVISRTRKVSGKRSNDLTLIVNGNQSASGGIVSDTQEKINTLLGMDFNTFTQSILLWHGSRPFSQMTDKEQKAVLEDILQIGQISKAHDLVKEKLAKVRLEYDISTNKMKLYKTLSETTYNEYLAYVQKRDQYDGVRAKKRQNLLLRKADIEIELDSLMYDGDIAELLRLRDYYSDAIAKLDVKFKDVNIDLSTIVGRYTKLRDNLNVNKISSTSEIMRLKKDIHKIQSASGKRCLFCLQTLSSDVADGCVSNLDKEVASETETLEKVKDEIARLASSEYQDKKSLKDQLVEIEKDRSAFFSNKNNIEKTLSEISTNSLIFWKLVEQLSTVQQDLLMLLSEENPYLSLCEEKYKQYKDSDAYIALYAEKQHVFEEAIQYLSWWETGFSNQGLKSFVIERALPFLENRAQKYADILSGGDLRISFSAQKKLKSGTNVEKFQVVVVNQQGADVYEGNSDGEKRRVDIAVGWALGDLAASRASKSIQFKGLDEPFENLDEVGEDAVIRLLHSVVDDYETVLCVTQSTHLQHQFPSTIVVTKSNGISTIN